MLHKTLKDGNDLEEWMPTFKTCAKANGWNAEAKSKSPMQPFRGDMPADYENKYSKSAQEDISM